MTASPLVSVLINNYNYGRFLRDAIDSALNQTYPNKEIIVVDDGSTDDSREIIASYGDRIIPVLKENGGQASAFNAGFAECRGEWVALLDSDDVFAHRKIEELLKAVQQHPSVGLVGHNLDFIDEHGDSIDLSVSRIRTAALVDARSQVRRGKLDIVLPATSGLFFRRDLLSQILPMPLDVYDNYMKFVALAHAPALVVTEPLAKQRIHGQNFYTATGKTEVGKINQAFVAVRTAYRLRMNFPYLARVAWKSYGRALCPLLMSRHPDSKRILSTIRTEYRLLDYAPLSLFFIGGALTKALVRHILRSGSYRELNAASS